MFFRRDRPKTLTFNDRMDSVKQAGFAVNPLSGGVVRVSRGAYAVDMKDDGGIARPVHRAGVVIGSDVGELVDAGYQKFFRTEHGKQKPATAEELKDLHDFEEDFKEALGQDSYYNESLGTVSTYYLYDRVVDRDRGVPKRVWES